MDNRDKYVQYVIAQLGEGNHSYKEIVEDLKERGLSESDISEVLQLANYEGYRMEEQKKESTIVNLIARSIPFIIIVVLFLLQGIDVLKSYSFWWLLGCFITILCIRRFKKNKFSKKKR